MNEITNAPYFLRRWGYYEKNREWLETQERQNARYLFKGLEGIGNSEVRLLAEKYHTGAFNKRGTSELPSSDNALAEQNNITVKAYHDQRLAAEQKLLKAMNELAKLDDPADYCLCLGTDMYLTQVSADLTKLEFISDTSQAKLFHRGSLGDELAAHYNLCKEPKQNTT